MTTDRFLFWLVRLNAAVLLLATPFAFMPFAWMHSIHQDVLSLGPLPDSPITRYMARSLAVLYATFGLVTLYITLDWQRYHPAVPLLAWLHVAFGCGMIAIDFDAGLPLWWVAGEGPPLVGMGFLMMVLYRRAKSSGPVTRQPFVS
jgi:hypothetical protein